MYNWWVMSEFYTKFEKFESKPVDLENSKEYFTWLDEEKQINLFKWIGKEFGERIASLLDTEYSDSPKDIRLKQIKTKKEFFQELMNFESSQLSTNKRNETSGLSSGDIHSGPFLIEYLFEPIQVPGLNKEEAIDTVSKQIEASINGYIEENDLPENLKNEIQEFANNMK